jgi:hypothetical protein
MTNFILGIFAKRSKLVDKKDMRDIAGSTIQLISLILLVLNHIFLDGEPFKTLSGLLLLVVIILFVYSVFIQFKKLSTIPDATIIDFERPESLTVLEEGNLTSINVGGMEVMKNYSLNDKEVKTIKQSLQVKNIGILFKTLSFDLEYKTRNFIVEHKLIFKDGLTEGILNNSSSHSNVHVKITQVEFDNNAHPVTINMCNQTYQTELPYMLVHIEYSKS